MSITLTKKELESFAKEFALKTWNSKEDRKPKTQKVEKSKHEKVEVKITKKIVQDKLKTSKTVGQSYYNVDTGKLHTANPKAKKEFLFYELGKKDTIYISGKEGSSVLSKTLQDLGFEDTEPITFEKPVPKKKPVSKEPSPKKPAKRVVKKKTVKKVEPEVIERRIAFDEDKGLFGEDVKIAGKEIFVVYYEPNIDPENTEDNRSVIGKWNSDEEKTIKLTLQETVDIHKMNIPLYHMKIKKRPVKRVTTQKEIDGLVNQMKNSAFFKSMVSEEEEEEEKEPESEEEEEHETKVITMLDSESEPEGPEDGKEEEILEEFEKQISKHKHSKKTIESEPEESDEDEAEANMRAIDEAIEDYEEPEITKEDFEKYRANFKLSSDIPKMSGVTGLSKTQIFFIADNYKVLESKYPLTRKPKSKKPQRRLGRKL